MERAETGAVTDCAQVVPIPPFQVFNLSNAAICPGAALLLLAASGRPAPAA